MRGFLLFLRRHGLIVSLVVLFIICTLLYLYLDRLPATNDAFVVAKIRPVSTRIAGFVDKIIVNNNQYVKKGQLLYEINPKPFQLTYDKTKVELQKGQTQINALQIQLLKAKESITEKQLTYQTAQYNFDNAKKLFIKKSFPKAKLDDMGRSVGIALADLNAAKLQHQVTQDALEQAKNNVASLRISVEQAALLLSYTKVYALSNGIISNLNLAPGAYVKAGQPLFAFIDTTRWWVQANIKETQLAEVKVGDKVNITLSLYPHHTFHGVIDHIGWAVQRQKTDQDTFLAQVQKENQWFLLPQRFPVMVRILDAQNPQYPLHVGASAQVQIRTND